MQILLVEDDALLADGIVCALKREGFAINHVPAGETACIHIKADCPDIVILDLGLPDMEGLDVLNFIRKHHAGCQVLILTARDSLQDKVVGLDSGADDYLAKPFEPLELMARLRVLERRLGTSNQNEIVISPVALNTTTHKTTLEGKEIFLSRKEYMLLKALMENSDTIHSRESLEAKLYSWGEEILSNAISVHMHNLRKKLPSGFIQTVRGIGYMVRKA
ncbi:MAG: response regulator [Nitrospiria bacterium]